MQKFVTSSDQNKQQTLIVPVCSPNGVIKYVRVNPHIRSTIVGVRVERGGALSVYLQPGLEEKGWALLADLMHDDNADRVWSVFSQWMTDGPMVTQGGEVAPWPKRYWPTGVIARRGGSAAHQSKPAEISIPELDAEAA